MTSHATDLTSARSARPRITRAAMPAAIITLLLNACSPQFAAAQPDEQGHNHGPAAAKKPETKKVDEHGHDHGGHTDEVKLTEEGVRRSGIRIATARPQRLNATISAPARVAFNAEAMAHVGSLVNGRATTLKARVGDVVKKGDVLAVIDSAELGEAQSDYLQKRTSAENLAPVVELAKAAYERAQKIYDESQGISLTEVQTRQREYRMVQGEHASAKTAMAAAKNRLLLLGMAEPAVKTLAETGKIVPTFEVRAPIDGSVIEREVTLGELVGPDKSSLFVLADLTTVWVLADVPEAQSGTIIVGLPVDISVVALGAQTVRGTVAYLSPQLDPSTRAARVRVQVENTDGRLRAGMFARAGINSVAADGQPVIAVPDDAIQTVEGEPAVFVPVAGEPNTFAKRQVGIGPAVGGMVPVFAGLKDGEQYVIVGSFILKAELGKAGAAHEH